VVFGSLGVLRRDRGGERSRREGWSRARPRFNLGGAARRSARASPCGIAQERTGDLGRGGGGAGAPRPRATRGVSPQPWAGAPPTGLSTVTIPLQGAPRRPRRARSRAASYRGGRGTRRARRGHGRREHNASPEHSLLAPERRLVVPYYSAAATAPAARCTTTAVMLSVDPKA
jgi:hypothetical protein